MKRSLKIGESTSSTPKLLKHSDVPDVRNQLLEQQGNLCLICQNQAKSPCLDHSHTKRNKGTGLVRGVLCRSCNVLVAKMENNCVRYSIEQEKLPQVLRNMAAYLEKPHLQLVHPSETPKPPKLKKISYNRLKKAYKGDATLPEYPKSGKLTKKLERLFKLYEIEPEFYK